MGCVALCVAHCCMKVVLKMKFEFCTCFSFLLFVVGEVVVFVSYVWVTLTVCALVRAL